MDSSRRKFDYDSENDFILWGEKMNQIGKYGCDDFTIFKYEDIIIEMLQPKSTFADAFKNSQTNSEKFIPILLEGIVINVDANEILIVHLDTKKHYYSDDLLHLRRCISQYYHINAKVQNTAYTIGDLKDIELGTKVVVALSDLFLKDTNSPMAIYANLIDIMPLSTEYYLDDKHKLHGVKDYMIRYNELSEQTAPVERSNSGNSSEGCYIATAVYGSYDCPEVWTLRRYRDLKLYHSKIGTLFVRTYYAISPILIKLVGKERWFQLFSKYFIDKIVKRLQKNGYSSEKYSDK